MQPTRCSSGGAQSSCSTSKGTYTHLTVSLISPGQVASEGGGRRRTRAGHRAGEVSRQRGSHRADRLDLPPSSLAYSFMGGQYAHGLTPERSIQLIPFLVLVRSLQETRPRRPGPFLVPGSPSTASPHRELIRTPSSPSSPSLPLLASSGINGGQSRSYADA